ncbi:MAG: PQQ-binding-like beta-propeller repeat protein [Gordonia paraffinivorans]
MAPSVPPPVTWTLDAAKYMGRPFGQFSDPRGGASFGSGTPGFVDTGDLLVTLAGSPTSGYHLDDAVMIGIDPGTGQVRWRTPAADVEGCGGTPVSGSLVCYASNTDGVSDIVTYDLRTGTSTRRPVSEFVFAITTTADAVYVAEGNPEDSEVRVHSGTVADLSANWTRSFDLFATWDGVYEDQVLRVTDGVGLVTIGGQMAQFAADSGAERWRSTDYRVSLATLEAGGVVVEAETDTPSGRTVVEQRLRAPDARVRVSTGVPTVQRFEVGRDRDRDRPVLMGDAAYDRDNGNRLWRSDDLVAGQGNGIGTVTAVTEHVVYLRDSDRSETGLDLDSGKRLWRNQSVNQFTPLASKDDDLSGTDGQALFVLDAEHGESSVDDPVHQARPRS